MHLGYDALNRKLAHFLRSRVIWDNTLFKQWLLLAIAVAKELENSSLYCDPWICTLFVCLFVCLYFCAHSVSQCSFNSHVCFLIFPAHKTLHFTTQNFVDMSDWVADETHSKLLVSKLKLEHTSASVSFPVIIIMASNFVLWSDEVVNWFVLFCQQLNTERR